MAINATLLEHKCAYLFTYCLWLLNEYLLNEQMTECEWGHGHGRCE